MCFLSLFLCCFFLNSCGFSPLYESKEHCEKLPYTLKIKGDEETSSHVLYQLRHQINARLSSLNLENTTPITIHLALETVKGSIGIRLNKAISRSQTQYKLKMILKRDGKEFYKTTLKATASYNHNLDDEWGKIHAQEKADERLVHALSHDVMRELHLVLKNQKIED